MTFKATSNVFFNTNFKVLKLCFVLSWPLIQLSFKVLLRVAFEFLNVPFNATLIVTFNSTLKKLKCGL